MELTKIVVVILVLVARTSRSKLVIATPSLDESARSLVDDVVEVVASCYGDRIQVGLIGDVRDDFVRTLSQHFIPAVLMGSSASNTHSRKTPFHHKLPVFIVDVTSPKKFFFLIEHRLQSSIWWNPSASVFILDRSPGCSNATNYLWAAWDGSLLNAKILCDHIIEGRAIYAFNPFTSKAPKPWLHIDVVPATFGHPFNVFYRKYRRNETICINLDFDKSKDFGGYPVAVQGFPLGYETRHDPNLSENRDWRRQDRIIDTISRTLNMRLHFTMKYAYMDIGKGGYYIVGETEMETDYDYTCPYEEAGLIIISQFRGHKSQLSKLLSVIDADSRIGLGIVYLITLIFLKLFVRQALVPALLNLVRITCNTGFTHLPDNTASRIYMTTLLFFVVTMQGIYQGDWAALLTQQIPLRQIETMQDLADYDYKVYTHSAHENVIDHPKLKDRVLLINEYETCLQYVINDSSVACIWDARGGVLDLAREFNLRISSKSIKRMYLSLETRLDWPPKTKVDVTLKRLVEGDLILPWLDKCNPTNWIDFQIDSEVRKNTDFKNMNLGDLAFSFVILGIGLLCATIIFIIELVIQYKCVFVDRQIIN